MSQEVQPINDLTGEQRYTLYCHKRAEFYNKLLGYDRPNILNLNIAEIIQDFPDFLLDRIGGYRLVFAFV